MVFFGNSQSVFTNRHFHALMESPCTVAAVVDAPAARRTSTNPSRADAIAPFTTIAREHATRAFSPPRPNRASFVRQLSRLAPDLIVAVGYTARLESPLLTLPTIAAVNFHASLLPAYRGKHPVFWALRNGERWAGLTVHVMDVQLDAGDMLYQVRVRTRRRDSVASLYGRIMDRSVGLVSRLVQDAAANALRPRAQARRGASYYSSTREADFRLDWSRPAETLRRWIVTSPGRCSLEARGRRIFVVDAETEAGPVRSAPGTIARVGRTTCAVVARGGVLCLRRAASRRGTAQPMAHICRELDIGEGDRLG